MLKGVYFGRWSCNKLIHFVNHRFVLSFGCQRSRQKFLSITRTLINCAQSKFENKSEIVSTSIDRIGFFLSIWIFLVWLLKKKTFDKN